ncbi:IS630 family transposase [Planococcus sp. ISL-110]|uniref:IS630 family transposase n=1 Tax=Planococcus sp. ISL-110 TaxID=2819167 RepID=UPI002034F00E|nr:IS630 family transposase [Planococcus sp. ISL-110]
MNDDQVIRELEEARKTAQDRRSFERYQALFLWKKGYSETEIAEIIGRCSLTVLNYVDAYQKSGIAGLRRGVSTGKPLKLSAIQRQVLQEIIAYKTPADVGFPARSNWTLSLVVQFIEREWGKSYTPKGASKLLHSLGLSYTRPTYTLEKADPVKQALFVKETFPALKKLMDGDIDHLLFEDESMIRDYQAIGRTWFLKGKQRLIPTYGKHKGVKLIGILNYETGAILCTEEEKYDAQTFLNFLTQLLKAYPAGKIVMVLDNSRIHHANLIQPFLQENRDRLELVFLSPYSPQLNLMEGVWKWLKETVINNVFFGSVQKIILAVRAFLEDIRNRREEAINRLCVRL